MAGQRRRLVQFRGTLRTDRIGWQEGPPGVGTQLIYDATGGELFGDSRENRRVQTAGEQHAVRDVGHQVAFHGFFQRLTQRVFVGDVVFYRIVIEPVALLVLTNFAVVAPQVAARRELFNGAADRGQRFHF